MDEFANLNLRRAKKSENNAKCRKCRYRQKGLTNWLSIINAKLGYFGLEALI